jgi:hypothetical protein
MLSPSASVKGGDGMEVIVSVSGEDSASEELFSLRQWLADEEELRGRVRLLEGSPRPGRLGGLPEAVAILLGPGGAGAVLATSLIAWIRQRTGDITLRVTRSDGSSLELEARRVRGLTAAGVSAQVEGLGEMLQVQSSMSDENEPGPDMS